MTAFHSISLTFKLIYDSPNNIVKLEPIEVNHRMDGSGTFQRVTHAHWNVIFVANTYRNVTNRAEGFSTHLTLPLER